MSSMILAVDDSPSVRKMVELTLRSRGFSVVTAGDGQEALEILERSPVDLVVLDINMPRLDGLLLLKLVRARSSWARLPILMLTTEGQDKDRDRALALGASEYMAKPFRPTELVMHVAALLASVG